MLENNKMSYEAKLKLTAYMGEVYQKSKKRMDVYDYVCSDNRNNLLYEGDRNWICVVDRCLKDCSASTRFIIRNEFLEKKNAEWYEKYFSRSVYYRLKKEAVEEFIHSLDI